MLHYYNLCKVRVWGMYRYRVKNILGNIQTLLYENFGANEYKNINRHIIQNYTHNSK